MFLEDLFDALFIDGELQVSEKDEKKYSRQFVNSALNLNSANSTAAIIGGGDAGVARECISKKFYLIRLRKFLEGLATSILVSMIKFKYQEKSDFRYYLLDEKVL